MTGRQLVLWPILISFCYLASSIDQAIYQATGLVPLYGQIGAMVVGLAGLLFLILMDDSKSRIEDPSLPAFYLVTAYLLLTMVSFLYSPQDAIVVDILTQRAKYALFLLLVMALFRTHRLRSDFEVASIGLTLLAVVLVIYDFVSPTFSVVPGRGAGLYLNPNDAGTAIVLLALIGSRRLVPPAALALWAFASAGVLATFSRGAWLMLIVSLFGLTITGKFGGGRARFVFVGFVTVLFLLVFSAYLSGDLYLFVAKSPLASLLDANTLARLGERGLEIDDYSTLEREDVFRLGIAKFVSSPFIGHGVGSTISWEESVGTHNMLVMLGAELGILGIAFYLTLFGLLLARTQGNVRLMAIAFLIGGMTSHNQFDTISMSVMLAYAIASMRVSHASRRVGLVPSRRPPSTDTISPARI